MLSIVFDGDTFYYDFNKNKFFNFNNKINFNNFILF